MTKQTWDDDRRTWRKQDWQRLANDLERRAEKLRGSPAAMAEALFDLAEKLGKSKFSSDPPAAWIEDYVAEQAKRIEEHCDVRLDQAKTIEELEKGRQHKREAVIQWLGENKDRVMKMLSDHNGEMESLLLRVIDHNMSCASTFCDKLTTEIGETLRVQKANEEK